MRRSTTGVVERLRTWYRIGVGYITSFDIPEPAQRPRSTRMERSIESCEGEVVELEPLDVWC
jgi:hypothetical protein